MLVCVCVCFYEKHTSVHTSRKHASFLMSCLYHGIWPSYIGPLSIGQNSTNQNGARRIGLSNCPIGCRFLRCPLNWTCATHSGSSNYWLPTARSLVPGECSDVFDCLNFSLVSVHIIVKKRIKNVSVPVVVCGIYCTVGYLGHKRTNSPKRTSKRLVYFM